MKKFLIFSVVILGITGLAACGGSSKEEQAKEATANVDSLMKMASDAAVAPAADSTAAATVTVGAPAAPETAPAAPAKH